jgi:hypothetical protein
VSDAKKKIEEHTEIDKEEEKKVDYNKLYVFIPIGILLLWSCSFLKI